MPTSAFDIAVRFVLDHEGGYVNDPRDPGGETKWGISRRAFPELNIAALTESEARNIYRVRYWQELGLDEPAIPGAVAIAVMDAAVNMGPSPAVKLLQDACNLLGCELRRDGDLGPKSRDAVRKLVSCEADRAVMLAILITSRRARYYLLLARLYPGKYQRFLYGWLRRCEDLGMMLIKLQMGA